MHELKMPVNGVSVGGMALNESRYYNLKAQAYLDAG